MSYQHWFTFSIAHDYFLDNACPVFELSPMQDTIRTLKNFGIQFQKSQQEYHYYAHVCSSKTIWQELATADDLYFQLRNTDQNFDNYTKGSLPKKEDRFLYITNSKVANRSQKKEIVTPELDLEIHPLRFDIKTKKTATETIVIKNSTGTIIVSEVSSKNSTSIAIDLHIHGSGIYELWRDHTYSKTFFATSDRIHQQCYGILHIQLKNSLASLKENTTPVLQLRFEARAAFWEYLIVISEDKRIEVQKMTIDSTEYSDPKKQIVLDDKTAYVFSSKKAIKLLQRPPQFAALKIQYTNQFSDTISELEIKMPVPSTASVISKTKNNERTYHTQTIIYV